MSWHHLWKMKRLPILPKGVPIKGTRLTPIGIVSASYGLAYRCKCRCGEETVVPSHTLHSGRTKSCGCLKRETAGNQSRTHGLSKYPEYAIAWHAFERCYDKKNRHYKNYGGRGIKCDFKNVEAMTNWLMKHLPKPSKGRMLLDRIDNNGNYRVGNLRWSTPAESGANTRTTKRITIAGQTKSMAAWARQVGVSAPTMAHRIKYIPSGLWLYPGRITSSVLAEYAYNQQPE